MKYYSLIILALVVCFSACNQKKKSNKKENPSIEISKTSDNPEEMYLLIGSYNDSENDDGIYLYKFDTEKGTFDSISAAQVENPSYLVLSPDEKHVYAVGENGEGKSMVHAFSFDKKKGKLKLLNSEKTHGANPCYIETSKGGNVILTANYSGGNISTFKVDEKGKLLASKNILDFEGSGPDSARQEQSHLHSVRFSPDHNYLFATDLGADKIYRFTIQDDNDEPIISRENMKEFSTPSGMGPRHFDFHPNHKYFYLLGELSGDVIVYDYNDGDLEQKQSVKVDSVGARGSAAIHVSPDGKFLYASNRLKADGIAIFSINQDTGKLTKVGYQSTGKHPRSFTISPNGKFLLVANLEDNNIEVYTIDRETGKLEKTEEEISVNKPVYVKLTSL